MVRGNTKGRRIPVIEFGRIPPDGVGSFALDVSQNLRDHVLDLEAIGDRRRGSFFKIFHAAFFSRGVGDSGGGLGTGEFTLIIRIPSQDYACIMAHFRPRNLALSRRERVMVWVVVVVKGG